MTRTLIYIYILLRLICLWSPASVLLNKVIIIIYQYTPTIRFIHPPIYYYCYIKPINARATVCCGSESKMAELKIERQLIEEEWRVKEEEAAVTNEQILSFR